MRRVEFAVGRAHLFDPHADEIAFARAIAVELLEARGRGDQGDGAGRQFERDGEFDVFERDVLAADTAGGHDEVQIAFAEVARAPGERNRGLRAAAAALRVEDGDAERDAGGVTRPAPPRAAPLGDVFAQQRRGFVS